MLYADPTMTSLGPDTDQTAQKRYTVHEAAVLLGLSVEAVRKRAERGKLDSVKDEDGTRHILLDIDQTKSEPSPVNDQTEVVEALQAQIEFLREELAARNVEIRRREEEHREESRRRDHIIAALTERIPELEPASEPREGPSEAHDGAGKGDGTPEPHKAAESSWWRRFFGL
jgi:excisionase family DNA binding protein